MNTLADVIQGQIQRCRDLLSLYQEALATLSSHDSVTAADIVPLISLKQQLIDSFEAQHSIITSVSKEDVQSLPAHSPVRALLHDLSMNIQRILMVDREIESILCPNRGARRRNRLFLECGVAS